MRVVPGTAPRTTLPSLLLSLACSAPTEEAVAVTGAGAASIAGTTGAGAASPDTAGTGASGVGGSSSAGAIAGAGGTGGAAGAAGAGGVASAGTAGAGGVAGAGTAGAGGVASAGTAGAGGVASAGTAGAGSVRATLVLTSTAFESDTACSEEAPNSCGVFPDQNISYGESPNVSPELTWSGAPEGTKSFAITLLDVTYGQPYWAIWNIPADQTQLPADLPKDTPTPAIPLGSRQSNATFAEGDGYFGPGAPCNVYQFEIFALGVESFAPTDEQYVARVRSELLELGDDVALGYGRLLGRTEYMQECE